MTITDIDAALVEAGWLDGGGAATDPDVYRRASGLAVDLATFGAPAARAYPTPEGGINLEWSPPGREISAHVVPGLDAVEVVVVSVGERTVQVGHVEGADARGVMAFAGFALAGK